MAKNDKKTSEDRSWRELDQSVNPRTMSASGRRRFALEALRISMFAVMTAGVLWGVTEILQTVTSDASALRDPSQAAPLREIVLVNDADGALTQEWVEQTLRVRMGTPLLEVDLNQLRDRLLAVRQIRAVDLRRDFPGTLTVALHERQPVLRLNVQVGAGQARTLLVARDGVVFDGIGYEPARLARLPFLDGVRLAHNRFGGYRAIEGMEDVANLLQAAQNAAPLLYSDWKIVSLARLNLYDEIVVKSRTIPEVVVSRKLDFTQQLARLDYIADYARTQSEATVQRIDLSLGGDVPVSFDNPPSRLLPASPVKPSKTRNSRDL